jgi:hypothetical protein
MTVRKSHRGNARKPRKTASKTPPFKKILDLDGVPVYASTHKIRVGQGKTEKTARQKWKGLSKSERRRIRKTAYREGFRAAAHASATEAIREAHGDISLDSPIRVKGIRA